MTKRYKFYSCSSNRCADFEFANLGIHKECKTCRYSTEKRVNIEADIFPNEITINDITYFLVKD